MNIKDTGSVGCEDSPLGFNVKTVKLRPGIKRSTTTTKHNNNNNNSKKTVTWLTSGVLRKDQKHTTGSNITLFN